MAEAIAALGVAASIAQFVSLAGQIVSQTNEFLGTAKQAPTVLRDVSNQLPFLIRYCEDLDEEAEKSELICSVIKGCLEHIRELSALMTKLLPTEKDRTMGRVWKATQTVLRYEKKIATTLRTLESYKSNFVLYKQQRMESRVKFKAQKTILPAPPLASSVTRHKLLRQIGNRFAEYSDGHVGPRIVLLLGMGGQGKSQLALDYGQQCVRSSECEYIIWLDASSEKTLVRSYEDVADRLTAGKRPFPTADARISFVKETLAGCSWLLILDNFDNPGDVKDIRRFLPQSNGSVLFTTRHKDASFLGKTIYIERMEEQEGLELLLRHNQHNLADAAAREEARKILKRLDHLPLAIDQASAYIEAKALTLRGFAQDYERSKEKVLAHRHMYWDYKKKLKDDEKNETPLGVLTTWEMSFQQIENVKNRRGPVERLLTLAAFLGNADIKESLFKAYNARPEKTPAWLAGFALNGKWDSDSFRDAIAELLKLSLVQNRSTANDECCLSLHPMIRDWLQLRIDTEARREHVKEAIAVVANFVECSPRESLHAVHRDILEHQDACCGYQETYLESEHQLGRADLRGPAIIFSSFYTIHGHYREAEGPLHTVLEYDKSHLGENHPTTLTSMRTLADVHTHGGQYAKAHSLLALALKHTENAQGKTATELLKLLSSLAAVCKKQGRIIEAEAHYEKALEGHNMCVAIDEAEILIVVENLAEVKRYLAKPQESAKLYRQALLGYDQQRGADGKETTETLRVIARFGDLLRGQCQYEQAEQLYLRAWQGYKQLFGPDHFQTATMLTNLGITCGNQEKYIEAERHLREAIQSFQRVLGPEHPDTLRARNNLAIQLDKQGQHLRAETHYREILKGREAKLGVDHHYTLRTVERLAWMLWLQDKRDEAETLAARVLRASDTAPILQPNKLFAALESLYRRSKKRHLNKYPSDHVDVLQTEECLSGVLMECGQVHEAKALSERIEAVRRTSNAGKEERRRESDGMLACPSDQLAHRASLSVDQTPKITPETQLKITLNFGEVAAAFYEKWCVLDDQLGLRTLANGRTVILIAVLFQMWLTWFYVSDRFQSSASPQQLPERLDK